MTLKKFIQMSTSDILCQSYKISERDKITAAFCLYDTLLEFSADTSAVELADHLSGRNQCVKTLAHTHECPSHNNCNDCWKKYIERECRTYRRTSFFETIRGDQGKELVDKVKSPQYIDWLYDILSRNNGVLDGEYILYSDNTRDADNGRLLPIFLMYLSDLIAETDIENIANPSECESERYIIKIKDKYFDVCEFFGQGSFIHVAEYNENPRAYYHFI